MKYFQVCVVCLVLLVPYVLLVYTGRIPAVHTSKLLDLIMPSNQTINNKWWFFKSSALDFKSSTNQNQTLNSEFLANQSQALNFQFLTNQNKVFDRASSKTKTSNGSVEIKVKKATKTKMKKKFLIYSCTVDVCGGLGDRQAGIISTFLLANLTKRNFALIMTKPCDIRQYLYPNHVQWDIPRHQYSKLTHQTVKILNRVSMRTMAHIDFNKLYKADVVYLQTNYIFYDLLKSNKNYKTRLYWLSNITYSQYFSEIYSKIFKPSDVIAQKMETFLGKSKAKNDSRLICAQIRLGRNPTMPRDDIRNKRSNVKVVWDFLRRYNDSQRYKIFVTTDSQGVRDEAKQIFPDQIMDSEGKIIHMDLTRKPSGPVCQGIEKVFLDQYILSLCDVLIHSRSNFGENAARLKKDHREVYAFRDGRIFPSYIV